MREIKFRAWDNHTKILGEVTFMNDVGSDTWEVDYMGNTGEPKTGLVLEQFTGLHDKNSREIYEGDILKHKPGFGCEWKDRKSVVVYKYTSFCEQHKDWSTPLDDQDQTLEVIGNIHENPELING